MNPDDTLSVPLLSLLSAEEITATLDRFCEINPNYEQNRINRAVPGYSPDLS